MSTSSTALVIDSHAIRCDGDMWCLGIRSTNGVNDHLLALERRGLIVRVESADGGKLNRNIRIVRQDQP